MTPRAVALIAALTVLLSVSYRVLYLNALLRWPWSVFGFTDLYTVFLNAPFRELHWPYLRFAFEYHPVIGVISALLSLVTRDLVFLVILWTLVIAVAAALTAHLLTRFASVERVVLFWAASPQLIVFGAVNFDVLAVLAVVAAMTALMTGRLAAAGVALAVGTATKLFPVVGLPPLVLSAARGSGTRGALVAAAALGALALLDGPAILAPYSLLASAQHPYHQPRWSLDSVWFPFATLASLALDPGAIEVAVTILSTAGLVASYAWLVLRPAWRGANVAPLVWTGVVLTLLWSRLYSPQYSLWVLPAFVLLVPDRRLFVLLSLGDVVTFAAIIPLVTGVMGPITVAGTSPVVGVLLFGILARHVALALLLLRLLRVTRGAVPTGVWLPPAATRDLRQRVDA